MTCFENRLIALLDVLGFSPQTNTREKLVQFLDRYTAAITQAQDNIFIARSSDGFNRTLDAQTFSAVDFAFDTIVLVSLPVDSVSAGAFFNATCQLMCEFAAERMPLRGTVGVGDYAVEDKRPNLRVAATTISEILSKTERQQEWSGCFVIKEHEGRILSHLRGDATLETPSQECAILPYEVPLKGREPAQAWCLNWVSGMSVSEAAGVLQHMRAVPEKQKNTAAFISHHGRLPRTVYKLPLNFRPAVAATIRRCGPCLQIHLWDEDGNPAERMGCKHLVFDPRRSSDDAFRGYDTDEEELALHRSWDR